MGSELTLRFSGPFSLFDLGVELRFPHFSEECMFVSLIPSFLARAFLTASLLVATARGEFVSLSGIVTDAGGEGAEGVTVALASAPASLAVTAADGSWTLGEAPTRAVVRRSATIAGARHLGVSEGRLRIAFQGRDVAGRPLAGWSTPVAGRSLAARAQGTAPDTLVYSLGGRVFLRDTLTVPLQHGIRRVLDTNVNAAIAHGYLRDDRDGRVYRTVAIGSQVWMAENLAYRSPGADSGWAYDASADSALKYGRLYTWVQAMGLDSFYYGRMAWLTEPRQGICPVGWHVPSDTEWTTLRETVEADARVASDSGGTALKSLGGWADGWYPGSGTDLFGFRALPGGQYVQDYGFGYAGEFGIWWTAKEKEALYSKDCGLDYRMAGLHCSGMEEKTTGYSVRCLAD